MRDEIVEVLVKCKPKVGLIVAKIVLYIICALGIVFGMIGGGIIGLAIAVVFGGAGYYIGSLSQVEYEYVYCDKNLDIDVIYSQSKRKSLMSLELGKMEALVRVEGNKMREFASRKCVVKDFSTGNKDTKKDVYALFYDGNLQILLEPNERLLGAISYVAPRKIFKD